MRRAYEFASVSVLLLLVGAVEVQAGREHRRQGNSQPGVFDYYVLALSWSPEFCYSHRDRPECQSGHHGFLVHGLWPQFVNGYPENCSNESGLADPSSVSDIMPDAGLVAHEWSTHGTCSGLDAEHYFKLIRQAFASIKVPARFAAPTRAFSITPVEIKEDFLQANPNLRAEDLTVSCGNNYLTAVSVCMSKTLEPTACQSLRDCRANTVRVPPVR
ncbi:MAG: ribonuclease T2 family protein [Candidatus Sulfotelmatobacter sp.]